MKKLSKLPLNGLEKFMLAHESLEVSYNSQIIVEFDGLLNIESFKKVIKKAVKDIPWLRTTTSQSFFSFNRNVVDESFVNLEKALIVKNAPLNQDELDEFCKLKFDLLNAHSFTFLISPISNSKTQLIFNVHHTLCDAAGQFLLLEEFFRLINNEEVRPEAKKIQTFRYRNLFSIMGAKWFTSQLWKNRKSLKKQRQYKMAGLIDHPENPGRTVSSLTIQLSTAQKENIKNICKEQQASCIEYLTYTAFSAYDLTLKERNDFTTPIMAYIPKTLRSFLKIRYSFQNILSTVIVVGKREDIHKIKFLLKIKGIIQGHKMDQAGKFIFSSLLPSAIALPKALQKYFKDIDNDKESITSSMLISAGKVPKSFAFPKGWSDVVLWARGTMLKSPGVGIIFTGSGENETITIEFVKELTDLNTVLRLQENLMLILSPAVNETKPYEKTFIFPDNLIASSGSDTILTQPFN
jgi:NRPS condensation-like uncharacterized protein